MSGWLRSAVPVVAAAVVLAGCGGSTTTGSTGSSTPPVSSASASATGSDQASQLNALKSSVQSGKLSTFKAVYSTGGSSSGTLTFEQKPPKSVFKATGVTIINTGTATYECPDSPGTPPQCISYNVGGANPGAGLQQLISPDTAVSFFQQAAVGVGAHLAGYNVSLSTQTFAGQDATCASVTGQGQSGKYCVTKSGILAYAGSAQSNLELTAFSSSVSDSDFTLPAGATMVTIPSAYPTG